MNLKKNLHPALLVVFQKEKKSKLVCDHFPDFDWNGIRRVLKEVIINNYEEINAGIQWSEEEVKRLESIKLRKKNKRCYHKSFSGKKK